MVDSINHDIRNNNGRSIILPAWKGGQVGYGNLVIPDIRDVDSSQVYPIGTKMLDGERVFYYAKTTATGITRADLLVKNAYHQCIAQRSVSAIAAVGAKTLIITIGADGVLSDSAIAENELAGGYVVVFPRTAANTYDSFVCRILKNTATTTTADEITLTLQDEIPIALDTDSLAECIHNPFAGCQTDSVLAHPVIGFAHAQVTGAKWFWLQTWGPIWVSIQAAVGVAGVQGVVARHDGSLDIADATVSGYISSQAVGHIMSETSAGAQAAPFVMLQICP